MRRLTAVISCSILSIVVDWSLSDIVVGSFKGDDILGFVFVGVRRLCCNASENSSCRAGLLVGFWFGLLPGIASAVCRVWPRDALISLRKFRYLPRHVFYNFVNTMEPKQTILLFQKWTHMHKSGVTSSGAFGEEITSNTLSNLQVSLLRHRQKGQIRLSKNESRTDRLWSQEERGGKSVCRGS
ncbi:hypothetical protein NDU88_005692 [Pleurodeles waltl]|uniref:Uncharacterized protein n=1 Tax=Pleurodeles waltl TaxID=8319 RepID=A0AAV7SMN2_PLEWA|nr:hypothetical protein NDU88_005692 [Pleurodeles waltl]